MFLESYLKTQYVLLFSSCFYKEMHIQYIYKEYDMKKESKIAQRGLRISKEALEESIQITPVRQRPKYTLAELLAQIPEEGEPHPETDWGTPVGEEVL